jgi:hypothetical protein
VNLASEVEELIADRWPTRQHELDELRFGLRSAASTDRLPMQLVGTPDRVHGVPPSIDRAVAMASRQALLSDSNADTGVAGGNGS